jgi:hypothetical protein
MANDHILERAREELRIAEAAEAAADKALEQAEAAAFDAKRRFEELILEHGSAEDKLKVLAHWAVNLDQDVAEHLRRWA